MAGRPFRMRGSRSSTIVVETSNFPVMSGTGCGDPYVVGSKVVLGTKASGSGASALESKH